MILFIERCESKAISVEMESDGPAQNYHLNLHLHLILKFYSELSSMISRQIYNSFSSLVPFISLIFTD